MSLRGVPQLRDDEAIPSVVFMEEKQYYVYMMTNKGDTVLYTGVTNDLKRRVYEHKSKLVYGFTKKYNVNKLIYYEASGDVESAILREKQIKGGSRIKKIRLVETLNPHWKDLYEEL
jgi:putative endonuclease